MDKYCFTEDVFDINLTYLGKKKTIRYKCLICGYTHEYDKTWTDEKKAEVQAEMDTHHNEHIVP
jgi:predicted nucleic-acid-binding Zn-ribbon protein